MANKTINNTKFFLLFLPTDFFSPFSSSAEPGPWLGREGFNTDSNIERCDVLNLLLVGVNLNHMLWL